MAHSLRNSKKFLGKYALNKPCRSASPETVSVLTVSLQNLIACLGFTSFTSFKLYDLKF